MSLPHRSICWRRIDMTGLELLTLRTGAHRILVESSVICGEGGGFQLDHTWSLTPDWRAQSLRVERRDASGRRTLTLERDGGGWRVDGKARPDLDGADDPDLSVTPFCNTLALRRFGPPPGGAGELTTVYVGFPDLSISPSRQRYERLDAHVFRYVDLGLSRGFEADLVVDERGLVRQYPTLFDRLELPGTPE
jgi:hypothetical protein